MSVNRMADPDLESGSFTGWTMNGGATIASITGGSDHGSKHAEITWPSSGSAYAELPRIPASVGQTWSFNPSLKIGGGTPPQELHLAFYDGSSTLIGTTQQSSVTITSSWARYVKQTTTAAPSGTAQMAPRVRRPSSGAAAGQKTKIDAVVLTDSAYSGAYFDPPAAASGWDVVYINLDDAATEDMDLLPQLTALQGIGISFLNYECSDPSCSPNRGSFMLGEHAQNHLIPNINDATQAWIDGNCDARSIATMWTDAGGKAHGLGKFLHDLMDIPGYRPTGWTTSLFSDVVYRQYDCEVQEWDGTTLDYYTTGTDEEDYLTDDISDRATGIIFDHDATNPSLPLFLMLTPGNNHGNHDEDVIQGARAPVVSARPEHRPEPTNPDDIAQWVAAGWDTSTLYPDGYCGDDANGGGCQFISEFFVPGRAWNNELMRNAPGWHKPTVKNSGGLAKTRESNRDRVRSLQSAGEMIDAVIAALTTTGRISNTLIIVNSDNGWHDAHWGLPPGKGALYPTDYRVKMVIVPPGGTTPRTVSDRVTTADLYPTIMESIGLAIPSHVDGISLMPIIDDDSGRDKRKRCPHRFRSNKSWEDSLETGQPPSADGITGEDADGNEWLYISYEPDSSTAPASDKGQIHDLTNDPFCMNNKYLEMTLASRDAMHAALVATRAATGTAARTIALTPLPTPEFTEEGMGSAVQWEVKANETVITSLATNIEFRGPMMSGPEVEGENEDMPGVDGTDYIADKRVGEGKFEMHMWAAGCDEDGTIPIDPYTAEKVRDNIDNLAALWNVDSVGAQYGKRIPIEITYRDGKKRQARVEIRGVINYNKIDPELAKFVVRCVNPEAFWRSPERADSGPVLLAFGAGDREGSVKFDSHEGGTAPIQDGIFTLRGDIPGPITISDAISSATTIMYEGDLISPQRLEIDSGTWTATLYVDDTDNVGTEVDIIQTDGWGSWLRLVPSPHNRRFSVDITTGGTPSSDASLQLLSPIWYWNA